jgi:ribosomal-protein-alanine N-acetyltransferase
MSPPAKTTNWSATQEYRGSAERDPTYQGRGIGRRMMTELLEYASEGTVFLEVRTDNEPAISLYESLGFVNVGLRRRYYRASGADAYTMRRDPR